MKLLGRGGVVLCVGLLGLFATSARADLLNLTGGFPNVNSAFISISYNAATDQFLADGYAQQVKFTGNVTYDLNPLGSFHLEATIDATGQVSAASLLVKGDVGAGEQVLFQSNTLANPPSFGSGANDKFEFLFANATGLYAPPGGLVGVILDGTDIPGFSTPTFGENFTGDDFAVSDTFAVVPEPATLAFLAIGGLGMAILRRKRAAA